MSRRPTAAAATLVLALLGSGPAADGSPAAHRCMGRDATIVGTDSPNTLRGTPRADVIWAGGGDDVIRGLGGPDRICAGAGDDVVAGGPGNDLIAGQGGRDRLSGGGGRDRVDGSAGRDRTTGGTGRDTCVGWERQRGCEALFPPVRRPLHVWSPANEGSGPFTKQQAVAIARRFGLIVAPQAMFSRYVGAMRRANPSLILLAYMNGSFAYADQGSAYPSSWYAVDADGDRVRSVSFGNWLMNVSEPGWVSDRAATCRRAIAASGYDGCMLDMLGTAPLDPGYCTGLPIDPSTGAVWTARAWLSATSALAAAVKGSAAPWVVVGNGLGSGQRFFDPDHPTSVLLRGIDGGIAEAWIRTARQGIDTARPVSAWKLDVDMLAAAERARHPVLALVKTWVDGTAWQKRQWHAFALASFLLGTTGGSYLSFSPSSGSDPTAADPWAHVALGRPKQRYRAAGGVYRRRFSNGLVLANPGTQTRTVALDGTYVNLAGNTVTSVTLGPHQGEVLVRA